MVIFNLSKIYPLFLWQATIMMTMMMGNQNAMPLHQKTVERNE